MCLVLVKSTLSDRSLSVLYWACNNSSLLISSPCFFRSTRILSIALAYFCASNISSNFFFNPEGSLNGHKLSSWWQNMTFSSIALDTPRKEGNIVSSSAHLELTVVRSLWLTIRSCPSRVFCDRRVFFTVSCKDLVQTILAPFVFWKESLTCAKTSFSPQILGSWMKAPPSLLLGGSSPVVAYFKHSMIVYRFASA